jgi:transcription elongation GreA/GreB family factor
MNLNIKLNLNLNLLNLNLLKMKQKIIQYIKNHLDQRLRAAWDAMQAAQESANNESKSSAGDKYETARAMGQLDRDMHARMYEQARQERLIVEKIDEKMTCNKGVLGALVKTTIGDFFIAVSIGQVLIEAKKLMIISPQSPIGVTLMDKSIGEKFFFRTHQVTILEIL